MSPDDTVTDLVGELPAWLVSWSRRRAWVWLSCAVASLLVTGGCGRSEPPTAPPVARREIKRIQRPVEAPPEPADASDRVTKESIPTTPPDQQGFAYKNDWIRGVPWSVNVFTIERGRTDWQFTTTIGRGRTLGLSALTDQIAGVPSELGEPLAAVNGDFYRTEHEPYSGDPRGLQISRGELISAPIGKAAFWIDTEGDPHIENVVSQFRVTWPSGETTAFGLNEERSSNEAVLYTPRTGGSTRAGGGREIILTREGDNSWLPLRPGETYRAVVKSIRDSGNSRMSAETMVLSIGPTLLARVPDVRAGEVLELSTRTQPDLRGVQTAIGGGPVLLKGGKLQSTPVAKAHERHPRTGMGWNDTHFFLIQVDGRQRGFSMGMTLPELGTYLAKQGCLEAMNLDGGGSAEMWVQGEIVNRPCFGYERSTANGLVIVKTRKVAAKE